MSAEPRFEEEQELPGSSLKGKSAFMPVGLAPGDDELALIESLARQEGTRAMNKNE